MFGEDLSDKTEKEGQIPAMKQRGHPSSYSLMFHPVLRYHCYVYVAETYQRINAILQDAR